MAAVIGDPVRHSLSPVLHNAGFRALDLDWVYLAFPVTSAGLAGAIDGVRALGIAGLNVTMPHKTAVVGLVDEVEPAAAALDAVNTVVERGGSLLGANTDGEGFVTSLRRDEGFDPAGRRCLVIGAGGAGRAVAHALGAAGAAEVIVANRTPDKATRAASLAGPAGRVGSSDDADSADLVVNATPVGMNRVVRPLEDVGAPTLPVDPGRLGAGQLVVDLIYDPPVTPLLDAARARGAATANGLGMLIHQAALAFRLWTGEDPPLEVLSAAAVAELARRHERLSPGTTPRTG